MRHAALGVARVFEVDPNTVPQWLVEAAAHLQACSQDVLHDVRVTQIQLDELYALLSAVKNREVSEAAALQRLSRLPPWVGVAIDPVTTLLLAIDVGARTLAMAQCVVHQVVQVFAPDGVPVFLTSGFKAYLTALRTHVGHGGGQAERRQATGPIPKPRWMPLPQLLSAQVIQVTRWRRLVEVTHLVVFGTKAAGGRRVMTRCNGEAGLRPQLALSPGDDNFCVSHASLRQPLPPPEATKGPGSAKPWRPRTPAMAARLTDHVWTLREVLLCRVPPWRPPQAV